MGAKIRQLGNDATIESGLDLTLDILELGVGVALLLQNVEGINHVFIGLQGELGFQLHDSILAQIIILPYSKTRNLNVEVVAVQFYVSTGEFHIRHRNTCLVPDHLLEQGQLNPTVASEREIIPLLYMILDLDGPLTLLHLLSSSGVSSEAHIQLSNIIINIINRSTAWPGYKKSCYNIEIVSMIL